MGKYIIASQKRAPGDAIGTAPKRVREIILGDGRHAVFAAHGGEGMCVIFRSLPDPHAVGSDVLPENGGYIPGEEYEPQAGDVVVRMTTQASAQVVYEMLTLAMKDQSFWPEAEATETQGEDAEQFPVRDRRRGERRTGGDG